MLGRHRRRQRRAGLHPIKVNMVVQAWRQRGAACCPWRASSSTTGHILRFIEFMDVGATNGWKMEHVVPSRELVGAHPSRAADRAGRPRLSRRGGRALALPGRRRRSRLHLLGDSSFLPRLHPGQVVGRRSAIHCLFATKGTDFRSPLRGGATDDEISQLIGKVWNAPTDRYSEIRTAETRQATQGGDVIYRRLADAAA